MLCNFIKKNLNIKKIAYFVKKSDKAAVIK